MKTIFINTLTLPTDCINSSKNSFLFSTVDWTTALARSGHQEVDPPLNTPEGLIRLEVW